ncbi:MAG: C39 family peptidase, partial [Syntrophobacteraceae bacterium]
MNIISLIRALKTFTATAFLGPGLFLYFMGCGLPAAHAQKVDRPTKTTPTISAQPAQDISRLNSEYFTSRTMTFSGGKMLDEYTINGPPAPPPGYELDRTAVALPKSARLMGIKTLTVPAYNWVFGCSSVSAAMIAGYYDRNGFPNIYTGPANGGVMPLDNSSWPTWTDVLNKTYPNLPLAASHEGVDGRTTRGSIDDYWVEYGSSSDDPYITNGWTQHTWGDAIGDYMKTSQSSYGNTDGSTTFYSWGSSATLLSCSDMVLYGSDTNDGTYGRKLFYEARGYTVTDCYNQNTDNTIAGGFSFTQYKSEIDAGRPVMLNLAGHTIVGVGYDDSTNTVYIHDTWDYSTHTMTWGGSYSGMQLLSVSIVNLKETLATPNVTAWPVAGAITYGQTLASSTLSGGAASVPGTFAFTNPATVPKAGTNPQSVTFTPTDATDYNSVTGSVNVTVNKATPSVTAWPAAGAIA